jgi:capsular exopolysaccharide synthesis family protein
MAKVYEALRKAEEERKRRAGDEVTPVAPLDVPPVSVRAPVPKTDREPLWKRITPSLRRRQRENVADINKRRISLLQPDSYVAEQFRTLRGRIDALASERPIRTLVVSSPMAGEGKTTAAINLSAVTAMSVGRRVLLVDSDMRKPKVHQALGLRPEAGLAEVLTGEVALNDAIIKVEGLNLEVLAVRGRPSNPSELLSSPSMREMVAEVAERYDRVILDTPAALGVPDAKAVAELVDGVVMVVLADVTSQQDVEAALELLGRGRLLGVVLNGAHVDHGRYGYTG